MGNLSREMENVKRSKVEIVELKNIKLEEKM